MMLARYWDSAIIQTSKHGSDAGWLDQQYSVACAPL